MQLSLISDIHTEFGGLTLPGGDILLLAGDVCEVRTLSREHHSTKPLTRTPGNLRAYDFFNTECAKYQKVYYVIGNHEHYFSRLDQTADALRSMLPSNVVILDDESVDLSDEIRLVGGTLWTNMDRRNDMTMWNASRSMADYKAIQYHDRAKNAYHKLSPIATCHAHDKTLRYFRETVEANPGKKFVIMSHHAPSFASVSPQFIGDPLNGAFASELSEFILDHPNIAVWCHGHMHSPADYMIGGTRVLANPRGYCGHEDTGSFNAGFTFTV